MMQEIKGVANWTGTGNRRHAIVKSTTKKNTYAAVCGDKKVEATMRSKEANEYMKSRLAQSLAEGAEVTCQKCLQIIVNG